jgi:DNA-binding MurR/RpiR family transcriptional regulator
VELTAESAIRASVLAQRILGVDVSSEPLRLVSDALSEAGAAIGRADDRLARARLDSAATLLAAALRTELRGATRASPPLGLRLLAGSLADALRDAGASR